MRILIIDDNIDKITELSELIYEKIPNAFIETSENITNAMLLFSERECYNLAVIDLLLPLRANDRPLKDGGKILLNDLYRKSGLNIPNYIIGFTQSDEELDFSSIWNTIYFDNSGKWKKIFNDLLQHISSTKFIDLNSFENLPTLYVEGLTDVFYINSAVEIYYKEYAKLLNIVSQKNAGANWIANQITIWALKLQKIKESEEYLKAVGLLDSDDAGNKAKRDIDNKNLTENQKKCFNILQIQPNCNPKILKFYQKKCKIELEIESLFSIEILKHAESMGWLEYRQPTFIENPSDWEQHKQTSIQYITDKGIEEENLLYLKKVKRENKKDFCDYVGSIENKDEVFSNFKLLIENLLKALKILD